jgi:hypothetical protein
MDASNFATQLDLANSGLMKIVEDQLLQTQTENVSIRAELYKLNIYGNFCRRARRFVFSHAYIHLGKDSFFKAHKDTPRGTDMLGSLVIIYPTAHEGGEFVLRHKDREWKLDTNSLISLSHPPSLAYVAFYSDIQHEVLKVTGGCRVTLTYNLYLVDPVSNLRALSVRQNGVSNLQTTLHGLLKSPEFLPDGGTLGFGLVHLYPITFNTELEDITRYLKGEDAHVYRTCRELQLETSLQMIYDDDERGPEYGIMLDKIIQDPDYQCESTTYEDTLVDMGGTSVNKTEDVLIRCTRWVVEGDGEPIIWISPFNDRNQLKDVCMRYGNEVTKECIYCSPCMIVRIAPAIDRV